MAEGPILVISCSFAIMVAFLLHRVTTERLTKSKLLQLVSGLPLAQYWTGNYLFDVLFLHFIVGSTQTLCVAFDPIWRVSLFVFAIWPFVTVPFIYGCGFFFKNACATQFLTITALLLFMLVLPPMVLGLRIFSTTEFIGDWLQWIFSGFPNFPLVNSLHIEATAKEFFNLRNYTKQEDNGSAKFSSSENPWAFSNCTGEILCMLS